MQIPWGSSQALFSSRYTGFQDMSPVTYFTILGMPKCGIQSIFCNQGYNNLALFRNKRFMFHERCLQNVLKFDVFFDCKIFQFCNFWMPYPILEFIMGGIISGTNWKINKLKLLWFSCYKSQNYGKFWSVLQGHFIKHTPRVSEKCFTHFPNKRPQGGGALLCVPRKVVY